MENIKESHMEQLFWYSNIYKGIKYIKYETNYGTDIKCLYNGKYKYFSSEEDVKNYIDVELREERIDKIILLEE